jgi:hypothetical protein
MTEEKFYFLDAETKDEEYRVTSFSYSFEDLIRDFGSWMQNNDLVFSDMEYATICRGSDEEPIADLVNEDGAVVLVPREPDRRLTHRLVLWLRRLRNRL